MLFHSLGIFFVPWNNYFVLSSCYFIPTNYYFLPTKYQKINNILFPQNNNSESFAWNISLHPNNAFPQNILFLRYNSFPRNSNSFPWSNIRSLKIMFPWRNISSHETLFFVPSKKIFSSLQNNNSLPQNNIRKYSFPQNNNSFLRNNSFHQIIIHFLETISSPRYNNLFP